MSENLQENYKKRRRQTKYNMMPQWCNLCAR